MATFISHNVPVVSMHPRCDKDTSGTKAALVVILLLAELLASGMAALPLTMPTFFHDNEAIEKYL
jgi:hypothetical protein